MQLPPRAPLLLFLASCAVATAGWWQLWFLTDDAFITFRYASNWMLGWGFTWNPPPFQPVEGYSNFLWLVLLTAIWAVTGATPPAVANLLALAFGFVALALTGALVWRSAADATPPWRTALLGAALLALCTQRTFLTWLSSGLETALWNALVLWWVLEALRAGARSGALPRLAAAAAGLALTRPDGLGFWLATGVTTALVWALPDASRAPASRRQRLALAAWLALPLLHLLWRRHYYGDWLPNTYYAKVVAPWPEMGVRYLASFAIEHGLAVWIAAGLVALVLAWRRGVAAARLASWRRRLPGLLAVATLVAHLAYYVLIVGGDHFEYRVLSHLLPLFVASLTAALGAAGVAPPRRLAALVLFWLVSLPIPWVHFWHTRALDTRRETFEMRVPIADAFPRPLRPLVARWDALQDELIGHAVGTRRREHLIFYRYQVAKNPPRSQGATLSWSARHRIATGTVGVPGWVLPEVAILDTFGLNDRVVARAPPAERGGERWMAHDRVPPDGYLACLAPDLAYLRDDAAPDLPLGPDVEPNRIPTLVQRAQREPLGDARIRDCESRAWY